MKLEGILGCNLDLQEMGSLIVAENDAEMIELEKLYVEKKEYGLEVREWSKVIDYVRTGDVIKGVILENCERIMARHVIITAGA